MTLTFEYFWFVIMPAVGLVMLVATPIIVLLLYFRYFHPTARKLNKLIRRKMVIFLDAHDSGKVIIRGLRERRGAGVGRTTDKSYRLLPKHNTKPEDTDDPTRRLLSEAVAKRFFLEDTGCPIFFGHGGTLCLTNPEVLALVEVAERMVGKKFGDGRPRILLDPRKLEQLISRNYDDAQLNAVINDIWAIVRAEQGFRQFAIPIAVIVVLMIGAIIALKMFIGGG